MSSWRILLLNTQMEAGGAQKASLELARGLKNLGHHVIVATFYDKDDYVQEFSMRYGLKIIDLKMKTAGNPLTKVKFFVNGILQFREVLRSEEIEILQAFDFYSNALGPLAARSANVPLCITSQRGAASGAKKWLRLLIRVITNSQLVQMMTAVSEFVRIESIEKEGINPDKMITIHNGVDIDRFRIKLSQTELTRLREEIGVNESAVIVTMVARLHPVKDHQNVLQAMPSVLNAIPNAHFLFIGDGPLREELEKEVYDAGLSSNVHLLGARSDIPQLLAISQLVILSSLSEGLPNVLLEAMAAGLPVVSTDVGGCSEVVKDGETGILVPAANPDRLATAILSILQNENLATSFGTAGRERAEYFFSWKNNLNNYTNLYKDLLVRSGT